MNTKPFKNILLRPFFSKRFLLFSIGIFLLTIVFLIIGFWVYNSIPAKKGGLDQIFLVKEGTALSEVAGDLEEKGIIKSRVLFISWTRLKGLSRKIKAGEYCLNSGMPPSKILYTLSKGAIATYPITIPEGFSRIQIGELLEENDLVDKDTFLSLTENEDIASRYGISGPDLEGYLYPDTYRFARGQSAISVIDTMIRRFFKVIEPLKASFEAADMGMEEVVTLASIIEKETACAEERPIIASVFLNRLNKGMRLESDPTVIYGIKDFNGNLKKRHLSENTPFNTYVIRGLPPGPIANPGIDAIQAVLSPSKTDYFFFVSKNDGTHYFSDTLQEHNRAVQIYQKNRHPIKKK